MNKFTEALETIDFAILKNGDKEMYDAYVAGQKIPKLNPANDIEFILQLNRGFFNYYTNLINNLPESEQPLERAKHALALSQIETALKILSHNKNILDKNNFFIYNIAYVIDIIKRHGSPD